MIGEVSPTILTIAALVYGAGVFVVACIASNAKAKRLNVELERVRRLWKNDLKVLENTEHELCHYREVYIKASSAKVSALKRKEDAERAEKTLRDAHDKIIDGMINAVCSNSKMLKRALNMFCGVQCSLPDSPVENTFSFTPRIHVLADTLGKHGAILRRVGEYLESLENAIVITPKINEAGNCVDMSVKIPVEAEDDDGELSQH